MPAPMAQTFNLSALDSMVADFMASEALTEDPPPSETNQELKRKCEAVRRSILEGGIDETTKLIEDVNGSILQDLRLLFRLKKQKLVELLRKGGVKGDKEALGWIRSELAPLALNAYPEAYLEFKKSLLLLVYNEELESSPVKEDWSAQARSHLANLVHITLRQVTGLKDPLLVMLLKYLLFIHEQYYADQSDTSPEAELVEELSCSERYPAPLPRENYAGGSFPPKDVQAIVAAVGIRQHDAEESLKHADSDITTAFENELARIQLNRKKLHDLVLEYAGYRGLLRIPECQEGDELTGMERNESSEGEIPVPKVQAVEVAGAADLMDTDEGAPKQKDDEQAQGVPHPSGKDIDHPCTSHSESEKAKGASSKTTQPLARCSSSQRSAPHPQEDNPEGAVAVAERQTDHDVGSQANLRSPSRSPPKKILKTHQRQSPVSSRAEASPIVVQASDAEDESNGGAPKSHEPPSAVKFKCDPKLALILRLLRMVKEGQYLAAMDKISEIDGKLFDKHPDILFELWRFEVLRIAGTGAHDAALEVLRKKLTPLLQPGGQAELFVLLQETLKAIMSSSHELPPCSRLCSLLQTALQESLGLPGPALARLMKVLLQAHLRWFRKQRCQDVFQKPLGIDVLRQCESMPVSAPCGTANNVSQDDGGAARTEAEEGRTEGSHDEPPPLEAEIEDSLGSDWGGEDSDMDSMDEDGIIQVMEVLALPRAAAIDLLMQHDGNVEAAIMNVLND